MRLDRPAHHCPGCHTWSNASSGAAWSAASDPTDGRSTHAIFTDRASGHSPNGVAALVVIIWMMVAKPF